MDRNLVSRIDRTINIMSLSARRAWIEIVISAMTSQISVRSLSARRAWIEIVVSLALDQYLKGRSPQGERG